MCHAEEEAVLTDLGVSDAHDVGVALAHQLRPGTRADQALVVHVPRPVCNPDR